MRAERGIFGARRRRTGLRWRLVVWIARAAVLAVTIALAEYYVNHAGEGSGLFLAAPSDIADVLFHWERIPIGSYVWTTVREVTFAYLIGCGVGFALAFMAWALPGLPGAWVESIVAIVYNIPRVALLPIFILWFGLAGANPVLFGCMSVIFLMFYHVLAGLRSAPERLLDGVSILGGKRLDQVTLVVLPAARPVILSGLLIALPQALTAVIAAEMLVSSGGLGALAQRMSGNFNAPGVFAVAVLAGLIGIALQIVLNGLARLAKLDQNARGVAGLG